MARKTIKEHGTQEPQQPQGHGPKATPWPLPPVRSQLARATAAASATHAPQPQGGPGGKARARGERLTQNGDARDACNMYLSASFPPAAQVA